MDEILKADLEKCFEEMAGLLYLGLQATHEARTKALFVYQTLFNPALTNVHTSQDHLQYQDISTNSIPFLIYRVSPIIHMTLQQRKLIKMLEIASSTTLCVLS